MSEQNDIKQDLVREKIISIIHLIKQNQSKVSQYSILTLIVIAGFLYYNDSKQVTSKEAKILAGNAQNLYIDSKIEDAVDDFNNVLIDYPSTSAADISKFYLANDYLNNDMIEDAIILYEEISTSLNDVVLKSSVFNKIGIIYLDQGELDKSIDYFKKATNIKSTTSFNNQYFLNLAKVYKLKKNYIESLNIINTILEDSKIKYNIKNEAQELQGELNFLINK